MRAEIILCVNLDFLPVMTFFLPALTVIVFLWLHSTFVLFVDTPNPLNNHLKPTMKHNKNMKESPKKSKGKQPQKRPSKQVL